MTIEERLEALERKVDALIAWSASQPVYATGNTTHVGSPNHHTVTLTAGPCFTHGTSYINTSVPAAHSVSHVPTAK